MLEYRLRRWPNTKGCIVCCYNNKPYYLSYHTKHATLGLGSMRPVCSPADCLNTTCSHSLVSMLAHPLRRWPSIETTLCESLVFAELSVYLRITDWSVITPHRTIHIQQLYLIISSSEPHCEPHIVDVITIICYGIFKYWILSKDTKTKRNVNTFLASLRAYINYRCMYDLHWQKLYLNKDTVNILKRIRDTAF